MSGAGLEADRLVSQARELTGLDDLGEETWREGLDRLLASLSAEARLNDVGLQIVTGDILGYLANRLRILAWRRDHPEVARGEVSAPLVIVGQPRTGTTILYDLLAQDDSHRAPLSWEVDRPCPPPATATYRTDPRIAEVQAQIDAACQLIPGFTAFHPLGAELAQECVRITGADFRSMIFTTQYRVPSYARWLLWEADMTPAYRWHRRTLEHLQSRHAGERWLLKSPGHVWCLGALLAEYPDAVLVQTHRDPLRVVASVSALVAFLRRMACDDPSVAEAAAEYVGYVIEALDRSILSRREGTVPADRVVDVQFSAFMADPFGTIRAIYDRVGRELGAPAERRMREFLAAHPGDAGGQRYTFADTGLDAGALRERVRCYQEYFDVPSEPLR
jgi:Sulfotransferase family